MTIDCSGKSIESRGREPRGYFFGACVFWKRGRQRLKHNQSVKEREFGCAPFRIFKLAADWRTRSLLDLYTSHRKIKQKKKNFTFFQGDITTTTTTPLQRTYTHRHSITSKQVPYPETKKRKGLGVKEGELESEATAKGERRRTL